MSRRRLITSIVGCGSYSTAKFDKRDVPIIKTNILLIVQALPVRVDQRPVLLYACAFYLVRVNKELGQLALSASQEGLLS